MLRICLALLFLLSSLQGQYIWKKHPDNPVLMNGPSGSWDHHFVYAPCVLPLGEDSLQMWYNGHEGYEEPNRPYRIGYAVSADGVEWVKHPENPVIDTLRGSWRNRNVRHPKVLFDEGIYKMWLTAAQWDPDLSIGYSNPIPWHIGYMTSLNGVHWTEPVENPILEPSDEGSWADVQLLMGGVFKDSNSYRIWYNGTATHWWESQWTNYAIGCASSPDGINWMRYANNPVLSLGTAPNYQSIVAGTVTHNGDHYEMWYNQALNGKFHIYLATSPDGIAWTPYEGNPLISPGTSTEWDGGSVTWPGVLIDGPLYRLYYQSSNTDLDYDSKIGLALSLKGLISMFADKGYFRPGMDSVLVQIQYEGNTDVELWAELKDKQHTIIDSLILWDDGLHGDGEVSDSLYGGKIPLPEEEDLYNINFYAVYEGEEIIDFDDLSTGITTAGPVVFDSLNIVDGYPLPGENIKFDLTVKNIGIVKTLTDLTLTVSTPDTNLQWTYLTTKFIEDLDPGESVTNGGDFYMAISETCPTPRDAVIYLDIYSDGISYWKDSCTIHIDGVGVVDIPSEFKVDQNYPNPFNPKTAISYQLSVDSDVELMIYDIGGKKIGTLVNEYQHAGYYTLNWNASSFPSGLYFYRLIAGNFVETKKMLLMK